LLLLLMLRGGGRRSKALTSVVVGRSCASTGRIGMRMGKEGIRAAVIYSTAAAAMVPNWRRRCWCSRVLLQVSAAVGEWPGATGTCYTPPSAHATVRLLKQRLVTGVVRNGIVRHVDALNALKAHHLVSGLRTRTERQAATKATAKTAVWTVEKPEGGKDFVGVDR